MADLYEILGTGTLHEGPAKSIFDEYFPDATPVQLWGAGITFDAITLEPISVTCGGVTKQMKGSA